MNFKTEESDLDDLIAILNKNPTDAKRIPGINKTERKLSTLPTFHTLKDSKENTSSDDQDIIIEGKNLNVFPLQSLKDKLKKNTDKKEKRENNLFAGKRFTLIPYDMDLTTMRINMVSAKVKEQGGTVVPYTNFIWDPSRNGDVLIIISKEMPYEKLMDIVPAIFEQEIRHFTFLDCEWISACIRDNKCVDDGSYRVYWKDHDLEVEGALQDENSNNTVLLDTYNPTEHTKTGNEDIKLVKKNSKGAKICPNFLEINSDDEEEGFVFPNKVDEKPVPQKKRKPELKDYPHLVDYLYEPHRIRFATDESGYNSASSARKQETLDIEKELNTKIEEENVVKMEPVFVPKIETKYEYYPKQEPYLKKEANIKRESGLKSEGATRDFTYIIDDDDDDLIYEGSSRKKLKLEAGDVKGTVLEGVCDLDRINTGSNGEVVELRDFKTYTPSKRKREKENEKNGLKETILLCQPETKTNLNAHITKELEKLHKLYELQKDKGRIHACGKAIAILKAYPKKIESVKDISSILGIGSSTISKIKEILQTGKLRKVETMQSDSRTQVLELFDEVYGIGPTIALQLYNKGFRTIAELRNNLHLFNVTQRIGLKYFEEFRQKMPRETVTEIVKIVQAKIEELSEYEGQFEVICGGSYRRGRAFCGDVDIIMAPKDGKPPTGFINKLIKSLEGDFLTDHLSLPTPDDHNGETYLGVCCYKGVHRRIDFKICARDRFGPLTIYYTGGDYFNRSMRIFAQNKGYHLENYGLYPAVKVKGNKYVSQNIPCYTEHDVFRVLGLKYIPPEERDI